MIKNWPIANWQRLFNQVNQDCLVSGETVVLFTDKGYYIGQIETLCENGGYPIAREVAINIADQLVSA